MTINIVRGGVNNKNRSFLLSEGGKTSCVVILCSNIKKNVFVGYNWLHYISIKMHTILKQLLSKAQEDMMLCFPSARREITYS